MEELVSKVNGLFDTKDISMLFSEEERKKDRGMAALSYIPILWFVPFLAVKDSEYVRFHLNQGLLISVINIAVTSIFGACTLIPFIGILFRIARGIVLTVGFILAVTGLVNAVNGKAKELPVIGGIRFFTIEREKQKEPHFGENTFEIPVSGSAETNSTGFEAEWK